MNGRTELAIIDLKLLKSEQQCNRCPKCGNTLPVNAQLAHRINQGPNNTRSLEREFSDDYGPGIGKKIIHHPLNMALTCPGRCNSSVLVDNDPVKRADLLQRILNDIGRKPWKN